MHRGCFVWTPTPPLSGRRTPHPGPARVCVCVLFLARSGAPASWARFGAPHSFLWPVLVRSLFARPPSGLGYPVCGCCLVFSSCSSFFFFFPFCALLSPAFRDFRPGVPWAGASCGPQPPPLFVGFFCAPLSLAFVGSRPGVPWALALCGPPAWPSSLLVFFSSSPRPPLPLFFFFVISFPFPLLPFCVFLPCSGVPVLRFSGWFVCPGLSGVPVCVAVSLGAPWLCPLCVCCCLSTCGVVVCFVLCLVLCGVPVLGLVLTPRCCPLLPSSDPLLWPVVVFCPGVRCCVALVCRLSCGVLLWCRVVTFALAGAVWCCLWLLAVRCWVWMLAVVSRWRVLLRMLLPGRGACCPAVCCGLL